MQSKIFIEERIADSKKILHYSNNKFRTFREFNFRERKKERRGWCQFKKKKKSTVHLSTVHILIPSFHPRHAASRTSADRTPDNRSRSGRIKAATQAERAAPKTVAFRCGKNGKGKSIARPRQRRAGAGGGGRRREGRKGHGGVTELDKQLTAHVRPRPIFALQYRPCREGQRRTTTRQYLTNLYARSRALALCVPRREYGTEGSARECDSYGPALSARGGHHCCQRDKTNRRNNRTVHTVSLSAFYASCIEGGLA